MLSAYMYYYSHPQDNEAPPMMPDSSGMSRPAALPHTGTPRLLSIPASSSFAASPPFVQGAQDSFYPTGDVPTTMEAVDSIIPDYDVGDSDGSESLPETVQGTEALAEATKSLISLDSQAPSWTATFNRVQKQIGPDGNFSYSPFARGNNPSAVSTSPPPRSVLKHTPFLPVANHPPSTHYSFYQQSSEGSQRVKRPSFSETSQEQNKRQRGSPTSDDPNSNQGLVPKTTLLTPSQKKANHIQSEQKRRANIKRGYEALCETIPALREAIRAEEEQNALNQASAGKKRSRSGKGLTTEDGDKIDGRAGPRSENVVLQKTIDHLRAQLETRARLKERLLYAESRLPPGHTYTRSHDPIPLWERAWDGGKSVEGDEEHESDEDQ